MLISNFGFAQNLVPNPSFEVFSICPTQPSTNLDKQIERCTGWTFPTDLGTSDYFNSCASTSNQWTKVNAPDAFIGYQTPFDGNGFCGFYSYFIDDNSGDYGTEYIQAKLVNSLVGGNTYRIAFYVSLADYSEYAITEIGAYFSPTAINRNDAKPFNFIPQISSPVGVFLSDTLNWIKIEGEFIAQGNEEYITIGNFNDSLTTDKNSTGIIFPTGENAAYYFIDGIEVTDITDDSSLNNDSIVIPNVITPNSDGTNDIFQLNFPVLTTEIYNRWGQQLFKSSNDAFWDGRTTRGNEVPDGTYYYIIVTEEETYKGFVQVIR